METVQIPRNEYLKMQEELALLRNSEMLVQMNRLVEVLFQEKYGLYMQDYTDDLTAHSIRYAWKTEDTDAWDSLSTT